jgi:hypothetical protein
MKPLKLVYRLRKLTALYVIVESVYKVNKKLGGRIKRSKD